MNTDERAIAALLMKYEDALNHSNTEAVIELYAPDGVVMPQNFTSSAGVDAVRKAYDGFFSAITLSVKFEIVEIRQLAPDWGFARTNSAGTVKIKASGGSDREANQELFVFQKVDSDWKIARYCFSTTKPQSA